MSFQCLKQSSNWRPESYRPVRDQLLPGRDGLLGSLIAETSVLIACETSHSINLLVDHLVDDSVVNLTVHFSISITSDGC